MERHVTAHGEGFRHRPAGRGRCRRGGRRALAGGVLIAATPLLTATLHLSAEIPALLAAMTVAVVLVSRWLGELQGEQRSSDSPPA